VQVNNAHMMVPTNAAGGKTVHNDAGSSTKIGASLLEGAGVQNDSSAADSLKCVATYNGNYDPLGADCT
jgi:hypothetical protein